MRNRHVSRRGALSLLTAGVAGLAGCSGDGGDGDGGDDAADATTQETTTAEATTAPPGAATDEGTGESATADARTTDAADTPSERDVQFESPAGATVEGTLFGSGDCGVVLVPQINMDRGSWDPQARRWAEAGYAVLPIDEGEEKAAAVRGAVRYLREKVGVSSVVLVGASSGGEAVVTAATTLDDRVAGVVAISPGGGTQHAGDLRTRGLFVVSESDDDRFVTNAQTLAEDSPGESDLVTYEGDAHGQRIFDSQHGAALFDRISAFLREVC